MVDGRDLDGEGVEDDEDHMNRARSASLKLLAVSVLALTACSGGGESGDIGDETPQPPDIVRFSAAESMVTAGETTTLSYEVQNASTVSIVDDLGGELANSDQLTGSIETPAIDANRTYTLTASNADGAVSEMLTVTVVDGPAPLISSFAAQPASIATEEVATLSWQTVNATVVGISVAGGAELLSNGEPTGTLEVTPAETTTYLLTATNDAGAFAEASATVTVEDRVTIVDFSVDPSTVELGSSATLSWQVTRADQIRISAQDGADLVAMAEPTGTFEVSPNETTTFLLTASAAGQEDVTETVVLTVNQPTGPQVDSFTATPDSVDLGSSSVLAWSVTNATSIEISDETGVLTTRADLNGSFEVRPSATTSFTLTARAAGDLSNMAMTTVTVNQTAPVIDSFTTTATIAATGSNLNFAYATFGASTVRLLVDQAEQGASTDAVGTFTVAVPDGTSTVILEAANTAGTTRQMLMVIGIGAPAIAAFDADHDVVFEGDLVELSWDARGVTTLGLTANGMPVTGFPSVTRPQGSPVDDSGTHSTSIAEDTEFVLTAETIAGTVTETVFVDVFEPLAVGPGGTANSDPIAIAVGETFSVPVTVTGDMYLRAETFSDRMTLACAIDTIITLQDGTGTSLGSDDDDGTDLCSLILPGVDAFALLSAGDYTLLIEDKGRDDAIIVEIALTGVAVDACGNGVLEVGELCDDGNTSDGDGCSAVCNDESITLSGTSSTTILGESVPSGGAYALELVVTSTVYLRAETFEDAATESCTFDTTMALEDAAGDRLGFDDDGGVGRCSLFDPFDPADAGFARLAPGTYTISVEEYGGGSITSFDLVVETFETDICGNAILEPPELCDDGNTATGDGCDDACNPEKLVSGGPGANQSFGAAVVPLGGFDFIELSVTSTAILVAETFEDAVAGTCTIDSTMRIRDDQGNSLGFDDDGGVSTCSLFDGSESFNPLAPGTYVLEIGEFGNNASITYDIEIELLATGCGNGIVESSEECDDGNSADGDGCSALCELEAEGSVTASAGTVTSFTGLSVAAGSSQFFDVTVPASAGTVSITIETFEDLSARSCPASSSISDTEIELFDDTGASLGFSGDISSTVWCSRLTVSIGPGDYELFVEGYLGSAVDYDIEFDVAP